MYGIYVSDNGCVHYASAIVSGAKQVETRSRNMLKALVGQRVAIIRTRPGRKPCVVGYATIGKATFCPSADFQKYFHLHCVQPGSRYDCHGAGKWFYWMEAPEVCTPYELPPEKVNHGRSWCEF